jgi:hypothetical protein
MTEQPPACSSAGLPTNAEDLEVRRVSAEAGHADLRPSGPRRSDKRVSRPSQAIDRASGEPAVADLKEA